MRRANTRTISEVLKEYVEAFKLQGKLGEVKIINGWPDVVGERIAARTKEIKIFNRKLYVKIQSSIIRQELFMIRTELVKRLNEKAGDNVIDDLAFF